MEAVVGLLLLLCGVPRDVETYCDGRQDGAQCYGALGGSVDIQLMDNTSEISRYQLLKNSLKILDVRNNNVISNTIAYRSIFPSNGTFRINNLSRNDSGNYTLQTFDSDGKTSGEWTLCIFVQAPVSSVLLLSECLSQGQMRVSCSSEGGDSPQYSWTLDGCTLTDAELLCGNNETNNITLKQHVSGHLVCSVRNNVSNVFKEQRICTCEAGILPVICGVLSALVIFLTVAAAVICAQRKKQKNTPTKDEEDGQQIMYADVRVKKKKEQKKMEKRVEVEAEVEYGQVLVKSSRRSRHTEQAGDDCLYVNM
ncbi:T-cell surface antigen CD2-like isoform X1 [Oreochromis niloticus]|uniref:T-cell surface antigen CD2-like isoform X1 n=1 Tax=Oreochromis niloticus TaxID=8128 RepID=UPI000DF1874E|nr:T-cell surface antigen CD2-like isoform X1 [Oreochromis niloticus]